MKNKTIWSNRFKYKTSQSFQKIGSSIHIDKRLYEEDIAASVVHTQMLMKQKIIKSENGNKIINEMKESGDYDTLVQTFLFYFGDYVDLVDNYGDSIKERYINE